MKIIFGIHSFPIKRFSPKQLIPDYEGAEDFEIQIRQQCFHLFFIPVFPTEKIEVLRKDFKSYEVPKPFRHALLKVKQPKTSIFSFALPILLILGVAYYFIDMEMTKRNNLDASRQRYESRLELIDSTLAVASQDHYMTLRNSTEYHDSRDESGTLLKVIDAGTDSISYVTLEVKRGFDQMLPYQIMSSFQQRTSRLAVKTLPRSWFEKAIPLGIGETNIRRSKLFGTPFLENNGPMLIKKINYYKGPNLHVRKAEVNYPNKTLSMNLGNTGYPVLLTEIEIVEGEMSWTNELPLELGSHDSVNDYILFEAQGFKTNTLYKLKLNLVDYNGEEYQYTIEGKNRDMKLKRVY